LEKKLKKASFKEDLEGKQKEKSGGGNLGISNNEQGKREFVQQNIEKKRLIHTDEIQTLNLTDLLVSDLGQVSYSKY